MNDGAYRDRLSREARHWGERLKVEALERHAWLDHPVIARHYQERALIDGQPWPQWVAARLGGPAERSLELGCGSAGLSLKLFDAGVTSWIDGVDVSADRVAAGEFGRLQRHAPGRFDVADANSVKLPESRYDLIFASHSFHHFEALEHVMTQVRRALTPRGLFVLEEYVGPTQFQWTDRQLAIVRELMPLLPQRYRTFRSGVVKPYEGRPTVRDVMAVSPFESIRSSEIVPLFSTYFEVVKTRPLCGTLQHLLYNGIIHNFVDGNEDAARYLNAIRQVEDALVDGGLLPSDFQLLVGSHGNRPR